MLYKSEYRQTTEMSEPSPQQVVCQYKSESIGKVLWRTAFYFFSGIGGGLVVHYILYKYKVWKAKRALSRDIESEGEIQQQPAKPTTSSAGDKEQTKAKTASGSSSSISSSSSSEVIHEFPTTAEFTKQAIAYKKAIEAGNRAVVVDTPQPGDGADDPVPQTYYQRVMHSIRPGTVNPPKQQLVRPTARTASKGKKSSKPPPPPPPPRTRSQSKARISERAQEQHVATARLSQPRKSCRQHRAPERFQ